jgi:DNA-binding response OmpR family regulator
MTAVMLLNPSIFLVQMDETFNQRALVDLTDAGYNPVIISHTKQALTEVEKQQPAMIILDRQRANRQGLNLCQELRQQGNQVLIITVVEKETIEERVACLEMGADDYFLQPYRSETLIKLVQFYLTPPEMSEEQLQFGEVILDLSTRQLLLNHKAINLTMKEFELLKYFMSYPREVLSREKILEQVWGYDFQGESNVIEVYIRYLRLKLESEGHKRLIHTVRGVGYVLREG